MRTPIRRAVVVLLLSIFVIIPPHAMGWGNTGHEAIAYAAWQQITPAARARAIELIKLVPTLHNADNTRSIPGYADWVAELPAGLSQDDQNLYLFMRAATWPDTIKHEWLKDSDTPPPGITTDVNIGFTDTASHGYWHFIDIGFASDNSMAPPTPVPNAATEIVAMRGFIASNEDDLLKSYDLIWIEHLVGDIHQPLHASTRYFAGAGDAGGNDVPIKLTVAMKKLFEGTLSTSAPTELHAFWDDLPGEGQPGPALPQAVTFGKGLAAAAQSKVAVTDPATWAAESLAMAEKDAYASPIGASPKPATGSSYLITTAYYNKAMIDAKSRMALAGARLAKLLNENLK
ncbi:MAG: S1/P1 nuclease [Terracidiphilus sp.]|jgi:hypothetical protein